MKKLTNVKDRFLFLFLVVAILPIIFVVVAILGIKGDFVGQINVGQYSTF